jgi:hypothetical protein
MQVFILAKHQCSLSLFFVLFLSVHGHYTIVLQESFNSNRESHTFPSLDGFIIDSSSIFIDFVTYAMPVALQISKATRNCADVEHYSLGHKDLVVFFSFG